MIEVEQTQKMLDVKESEIENHWDRQTIRQNDRQTEDGKMAE